MRKWNVHLKWTGVSHENVSVKADTKEEAEATIKEQLEGNDWHIFDHAWDLVRSTGTIEIQDGYDESEVEIISIKEE